MDKDKLLTLREKILSKSLPLVMGDNDNKQAQFETILRIIQAETINNEDIYEKAFDVADSIDDESAKMDAMMRLLDEIDYQLSRGDSVIGQTITLDDSTDGTPTKKLGHKEDDSTTDSKEKTTVADQQDNKEQNAKTNDEDEDNSADTSKVESNIPDGVDI
ncbi:hypothetical protein FWF48_04380 [Candidatus Saccharibacteria bacterium]|nr:hypothetical protein [Candidatus Saccharibacteria bacterium]